MQTCFLHSADWQLGKPFASLDDDAKRHRLQQERVHVIQRMAKIVEETAPSFVVVAGDVFDSPHVTKSIVSTACAAIGSLKVPVIVIPGNHDHAGPGSIWEQAFFLREQRELAPNLRVLLKPEPLVLDSAVIFPAPLLRRHETGNTTAWIRQAVIDPSLPEDLPRVIVAHGTIQGFGSTQLDEDGSPALINWIDLSSLPLEAIDYIALGDWHGTKQVGHKAWYSGTPEMDRFAKGDSNDPGNILKVIISRGQPPQVEKIPSGRFVWKEHFFRFTDDASLDALASQLEKLIGQRGDEHLIHLTLEGSLGIAASDHLEKIIESWDSRLIRLSLDNRVTIAPTEEEIIALTCRMDDPLIASVATELVDRSQADTEEAAIARIALRELHAALA